MRYLAVDLGQRRTGLAVGDAQTRIVTPVEVLQVPMSDGTGLVNAIQASCVQHLGPRDQIVIGLPVNMDGSEGPAAKAVRDFGDKLAARTGRIVHFMDERLTSAQADWEMARTGLTRGEKKQRRDALAAAAILRDFLSRLEQAGRESEQPLGPDNQSESSAEPADGSDR